MRNRAENQIILAFIRHGETQANAQRRYLGKTDESLSEHGKQLLLTYREQNRYPQADYLFVSPMKRCLETARILYPLLQPVIIPEWEEMDFGRFEYKNYEELKDDPAYRQWIDSGGMTAAPDGESREAFIGRCRRGWQRMCGILWKKQTKEQTEEWAQEQMGKQRGSCKKPVRAAAIVHGGTIMALLSAYGNDGKTYFDYPCANGGGYLVQGKLTACAEITIEETETL